MRIVIDIDPLPEQEQWGYQYSPGTAIQPKPYVNPCIACSNNPQNNPLATGFCNCALPAMLNPVTC